MRLAVMVKDIQLKLLHALNYLSFVKIEQSLAKFCLIIIGKISVFIKLPITKYFKFTQYLSFAFYKISIVT